MWCVENQIYSDKKQRNKWTRFAVRVGGEYIHKKLDSKWKCQGILASHRNIFRLTAM